MHRRQTAMMNEMTMQMIRFWSEAWKLETSNYRWNLARTAALRY
jgi:hypothetical protein